MHPITVFDDRSAIVYFASFDAKWQFVECHRYLMSDGQIDFTQKFDYALLEQVPERERAKIKRQCANIKRRHKEQLLRKAASMD